MKEKNRRIKKAGNGYEILIGTAILTALQSRGTIGPGGKAVVTITIHLPEETVQDLKGDALLTAKLSDLVAFPHPLSVTLAESGIHRVYQLAALTEWKLICLRKVGPRSVEKIMEFLNKFELKLETIFEAAELDRLRSLHEPDHEPEQKPHLDNIDD